MNISKASFFSPQKNFWVPNRLLPYLFPAAKTTKLALLVLTSVSYYLRFKLAPASLFTIGTAYFSYHPKRLLLLLKPLQQTHRGIKHLFYRHLPISLKQWLNTTSFPKRCMVSLNQEGFLEVLPFYSILEENLWE